MQKDLDTFIEENCKYCGSQRCIPTDKFWRNGCSKWTGVKESVQNTDSEEYKMSVEAIKMMLQKILESKR